MFAQTVVQQYYEADVNKEHVILGNPAILKCLIPSFVADFVEVVSWTDGENIYIYSAEDNGSKQFRVKLTPTSFLFLVSVDSSNLNDTKRCFLLLLLLKVASLPIAVIAQYYDVDVNKEYVIRGNSVLLKCQIPSYVADFIRIESWHTDQNQSFYINSTENDEGLSRYLP